MWRIEKKNEGCAPGTSAISRGALGLETFSHRTSPGEKLGQRGTGRVADCVPRSVKKRKNGWRSLGLEKTLLAAESVI